MQTNLNYLKKKFNVKRLVKRKKYKPYKKLLNNNKYNWWRLKRLIFLINKLTFIEKFISFGYNRNKPLNLFKVKLLLKKEKVKKRFYFKFSWKKKVFRRYRYFWRIKKIKLNKKFGKIKGNTQRNIIKNFFVIKALKLKEFKTSTINFLNKTKKISNYIKLRYKIRRKKRKLIANLKRWIKRRKKRKVHKNSLKLRKKGKRILKKKRKIRLHSKKNDFVWRVKWRNHRLFITMPKVFIKRRKSKRFFKKKFLYSKKFKRRRLKIKKFFKKALKRVLKKKNRYYKIEREFLFLWKQKIKKKSKRFNSILSKELMQKYKKWENERWKIKKSKNKGKKKKKKKIQSIKIKTFSC